MLLHKLDVPYVMPHTMAFVVDRARLSQFRQALRAVLEDGVAEPMRSFCASRRNAYLRERNQARVNIDVDQIRQWHALAETKTPVLPPKGFVTVPAHRYLSFLQGRAGLEIGQKWSLTALEKLRNEHDDERYDLPEPKDVSWARDLRFRIADGRELPNVIDPTADVVLGLPKRLDFEDMTPLEVLELARNQLGGQQLLELLVDPFTPSVGPGPFLPIPPNATPLQDPTWPVLPLFAVTHANWPLIQGHMLGGKGLLEAEEWVRGALPSRKWHPLPELTPVDGAEWRGLVKSHWPRCVDRFANTLAHAYRSHEAVLLINAELPNSYWAGSTWPVAAPAVDFAGQTLREGDRVR